MNDTELMARAALQYARAVEAAGENEVSRLNNQGPAYRDNSITDWDLHEEINWRHHVRRGEFIVTKTLCSHRTARLFEGKSYCGVCAKLWE